MLHRASRCAVVVCCQKLARGSTSANYIIFEIAVGSLVRSVMFAAAAAAAVIAVVAAAAAVVVVVVVSPSVCLSP